MVEVDPAVLIAGSALIATLVGVVVCMSSGGGNKTKESPPAKKQKAESTKAKKPAKAKATEKKPEKKVEKKVEKAPAPVSQKKVVEEPPAPEESPIVVDESQGGKRKKAKETPEQRAARLERQKISKQKKADEQAAAELAAKELASSQSVSKVDAQFTMPTQQAPSSDGWAVVEDRRHKKKAKPVEVKVKETVADESTVPSGPVVVTEQVMVDSKKIGGIIGPKGATLHAIQDLTEETINTPKDRDNTGQVAVSVSGTAEAVAAAIRIVRELNMKGYSKALEGENFNESAISVKYSYLSELIGKNGSCIRAIQDKAGVKISIPPNNDAKSKVRIGLAGSAEGIVEAKRIMGEIMTYYHCDVTHPGVIHKAMDVPERMYNMIIGSKGSEIKHIQNNFKVSVHIPNADSTVKDVLIVGQPNAVEGATKYIEKIVSNLTQEEEQANSIADTWNEQQAQEESNEEGEPWMNQYSYNRGDKVSLISKAGEDVLQKAQANAWKDSTSADGW